MFTVTKFRFRSL